MYHEMHTDEIGNRSHTPEIAELLEIYGRFATDISFVDHERLTDLVMPRYGKDLMVIDPVDEGDFIYSYFGSELTRQVGEDRTGQRSSAMSPRVAEFTIAAYGDRQFSGYVKAVSPNGVYTGGKVGFPVIVNIDTGGTRGLKLYPNMTTKATISA